MRTAKTVKYIVGVDISQQPIVVVHVVADDAEKPRARCSKKDGVFQKRKGGSSARTRTRTRESKRNLRLPIMDSKQPDNASQVLAEEPVQIVRAFNKGKILLVEEMPSGEASLPGVSFLIMKTNKGYLFRGMNGNTVGAGYWGLTGENIYEKTGHRGAYISSDGSEGCMDGLSGALAVCRSSFDDAYIVRPGFHDDYFSRVVGDDIEAMLKELKQVINLADDGPLIG